MCFMCPYSTLLLASMLLMLTYAIKKRRKPSFIPDQSDCEVKFSQPGSGSLFSHCGDTICPGEGLIQESGLLRDDGSEVQLLEERQLKDNNMTTILLYSSILSRSDSGDSLRNPIEIY